MCSEPIRRLALPFAAAVSLAVGFAACGKQGDPAPPPRAIPQPAKDLVATQRGDQVLLGFSYPASTLAGLPLAGLEALSVGEIQRPVPPPPAPTTTPATAATPPTAPPAAPAEAAAPAATAPAATTPAPEAATPAPPTTSGAATAPPTAPAATPTPAATPASPPAEKVEYTEADFKKLAREVLLLEGPALDEALVGGKFRLRLPLPATAATDGQERIYVVRTKAKGGEYSPYSNAVLLVPRVAPPAPAELTATATAGGVALRWTAPAGVAGIAVLRRDSSNPEWGDPLVVLPADAVAYVDRGATLGSRYVYTVVSRSAATPPAESAPVAEREVDYRDLFPPAAPTGLRALGMAGEVRLVWEASPEADVAGYFVERAGADGAFARLTPQPLDALEYSDAAAPAGQPLAYRIVAVDRAGNASEPSETATTQGPVR